MLQLKKAIKLESLRLPFREALIAAHQIGADAVEINGRTELRPEEMSRTGIRHLRKILDDLKLKVSAIYFPTRRGLANSDDLDRRIDAIKSAMGLAYQLEARWVNCRIGQIPRDSAAEGWSTMVQALTDLGRHSQKAGAWLAARTDSGCGQELRNLIDNLPAYSLGVDFDPASFIVNGQSPELALQCLAEYVQSLRARDAVTDLSLGRGIEVQLGRGSVDWASILGKLEENNFTGYITIDRDADRDNLQQCAQAIEFLTNLFE